MANGNSQASHYTVYYNPFSICSLQVLYTVALRGDAKDAQSEMIVDPREVDIFHEEQLSEHFLCEINDHGQVPVLMNPDQLDAPMADSLKITYYMAERYPGLMPSDQEAQIRQHLVDLHSLNYFSLSFPGRDHVAKGFQDAVKRRLADDNISDRYRKALEFKLTVVNRDKVGGLVPSETTKNEEKARKLMASMEDLIPNPPNSWMFGKQASALDAHLVIFIARMTDVGREGLIPKKVRDYGDWAMQGKEWNELMQGRRTMVAK